MNEERNCATKVIVISPNHTLVVTDNSHGVDPVFFDLLKKYTATFVSKQSSVLENGVSGIITTFTLNGDEQFMPFLHDYLANLHICCSNDVKARSVRIEIS